MLSVIGIIVVFLVSVVLMMRKKMPAIIAMPLMAILFALIAGVPVMSSDPETVTIFGNVLKGGSTKMAEAMAGVMFGAWFSKIVTRLGISKAIVQKAAELGGDNTLVSAIVFYIAASIIFIPNMSLGSVMLVGNIIIPIMINHGNFHSKCRNYYHSCLCIRCIPECIRLAADRADVRCDRSTDQRVFMDRNCSSVYCLSGSNCIFYQER